MKIADIRNGLYYEVTGSPNNNRYGFNYLRLNNTKRFLAKGDILLAGNRERVQGYYDQSGSRASYSNRITFTLMNGEKITDHKYHITKGSLINVIKLLPITASVATTRAEKAALIRKSMKERMRFIKYLETRLTEQREALKKEEKRAEILEKYKNDTEALAHMLAEAVKTGGDVEKMMKVLEETGVVNGTLGNSDEDVPEPVCTKTAGKEIIKKSERFGMLELD